MNDLVSELVKFTTDYAGQCETTSPSRLGNPFPDRHGHSREFGNRPAHANCKDGRMQEAYGVDDLMVLEHLS